MQSHERKVPATLDLSDLASVGYTIDLQVHGLGFVEGLLAGPFESVGPGLVAEPVADEVGVALCRNRLGCGALDSDMKNLQHKSRRGFAQ